MNEMLVSVVVVSYNSSLYITECLDSIKRQDYKNIELIVTDDCSTDNTIEVAQRWIDDNSSRFERAIIVQTEKNSGVAGNCNNGLYSVKGEWVKMIAGDDMLCENCISTYVDYVKKTDNPAVVVSDMYKLCDGEKTYLNTKFSNIVFENSTPQKQLKLLSKRNIILASSVFLNVNRIRKMGGWDEDIPMCEDAPMWLNITSHGYKIHYIKQALVIYRISSGSLVQKYKKGLNKVSIYQLIVLFRKYKIPHQRDFFKLIFIAFYKLLNYIYFQPSDSRYALFLFKMYQKAYNVVTISYFYIYALISKLSFNIKK